MASPEVIQATRLEFFRDIARNPDDHGLRLIFADWLEDEGGDPDRALFIRTQCARAGDLGTVSEDEQRTLIHLENRILFQRPGAFSFNNEELWTNEAIGEFAPQKCRFTRGMVEHLLGFRFRWLEEKLPRIVQENPIRRCSLTDRHPRQCSGGWMFLEAGYDCSYGSPEHLPRYLLSRLSVDVFPTVREALEEVSRALLEWAREKGA